MYIINKEIQDLYHQIVLPDKLTKGAHVAGSGEPDSKNMILNF